MGSRSARSVFSREYGFELAGFERAILRKKDVGFVVRVDRRSRYFKLAPSPFLPQYKTVYVVEKGVDIPPKGAFIRVRRYERRQFVNGKEIIEVKVVKDWEHQDVKPFLKEKPTFDFDDLQMFLSSMFKKPRESILSSISVFLASSPPYDIFKGGLKGVVVAKGNKWTAYRKIFDYLIPKEFQRESEHYYYGYQYKEVDPYAEPLKPFEICMDYVNPVEPIYFHIPQPLVNVETNPVSKFVDLFKDYGGGIVGYMIHYLHLQPKIENPKVLESRMEEIVSEIKRVDADLVLPPDFTFLDRIAKAVARLKLRETVKKEDIDYVEDVWLECYKETLPIVSRKGIPLSKYFNLRKDERIIYGLIKDLAVNGYVERKVVIEEAKLLGDRFRDEFYVERLLKSCLSG